MTSFAENPSVYYELATAVAMLIFTAWVGWTGRFRGKAGAFALAEGAFVIAIMGGHLRVIFEFEGPFYVAWALVRCLVFAASWVGLVRLFQIHARGAAKRNRLRAWLAMAAMLGMNMLYLGYDLVVTPASAILGAPAWVEELQHQSYFATSWLMVAIAAAGAFIHRGLGAPGERRDVAILSVALVIYPALILFNGFFTGVRFMDATTAWFTLVLFAVWWTGLVGSWVLATRGQDPRRARNVALASVALGLLGLIWHLVLPRVVDAGAMARVFGMALLGYGIVRHQYLGLDVKVRFALSKSTVAAIFVAVIFFVSEGAQLVFGDGNEWLGLAAGAALVFALAPLSRFADRVAAKAVPRQAGAGDRASEVYRNMVQRFMRDTIIDPEEQLQLAELADELGLSAAAAMRIQQSVDRS